MLMDEGLVALNDVIVHCRSAAARYVDAADIMATDPAVAERLRAFARDREGFGDRLETELRATGALPRDAESEIDELRTLVNHLRARLAGDETALLVEIGETSEDELARSLASAREHELSAAVARLLDELDASIARVRSELQRL